MNGENSDKRLGTGFQVPKSGIGDSEESFSPVYESAVEIYGPPPVLERERKERKKGIVGDGFDPVKESITIIYGPPEFMSNTEWDDFD